MSRFAFGAVGGSLGFRPFRVLYANPGQELVGVPDGAMWCLIRATGPSDNGSPASGSGGGAWSGARVPVDSLAALSLTIGSPGGDTVVRADTITGTILCRAAGSLSTVGGQAANGVGDTKRSGGAGDIAGGGAAGIENYPDPFALAFPFLFAPRQEPLDGIAAVSAVPGDRRGSHGGAGGADGQNGRNFGGGAGRNGLGSSGLIELFWTL